MAHHPHVKDLEALLASAVVPNELPPTSYLENPRCLVSRIKLPSSRVPDQESAAQPRCDSPKRAPMSSSRDAVSPQSRKWPRRSVGSEVMRLHSRSTSASKDRKSTRLNSSH